MSRLTQTLVGTGYLQVEPRTRAYRLAPAVLSLAHAMRTCSTALAIAAPHMRDLAQAERVNVGLAAPDRDEMVYLESIRYNRRPSLRRVVSGLRRPRRTHWAELEPALTAAIHEVEEKGFCAAASSILPRRRSFEYCITPATSSVVFHARGQADRRAFRW